MKRQSKFNGFDIAVDNKILQIGRNDSNLFFTHGEGSKLADAVGILQRMVGLPVLPPAFKSTPFEVELNQEEIIITNPNRSGTGVSFSWNELDNFVEAVYNLQKIAMDMLTLSGKQAIVSNGGFSPGLDH